MYRKLILLVNKKFIFINFQPKKPVPKLISDIERSEFFFKKEKI